MLHSQTFAVAALCGALSASPTTSQKNAPAGFNLSQLFNETYNVRSCNPEWVVIEIRYGTDILAPFPNAPVSYQLVGDTSNRESLRAKSLAVHFSGKDLPTLPASLTDQLNMLQIIDAWSGVRFALPPLQESAGIDPYEQLQGQDPEVRASSQVPISNVGRGDVIARVPGKPGLTEDVRPWIQLKHFRAPGKRTRFPYYLFPKARDACKKINLSKHEWFVYDFVPEGSLMKDMPAVGTYKKGA